MQSPYADHDHVRASCIQGECRDRLLADCHDWAEDADAKRQSSKWSKRTESGMTKSRDRGDNATGPIVHRQHLKEIHNKKRRIIM